MQSIVTFYLAVLFFSFVLTKKRILSVVIGCIGYILTAVDFLSFKVLLKHIDLLTISNFNFEMIDMAIHVVPKYFYGAIFLPVLIAVLYYFIYFKYYENIRTALFKYKIAYVLLFVASIGVMIFSKTSLAYKDTVISVYNHYKYSSFNQQQICEMLKTDGNYINYNDIEAQPGKNLVIIYCESLESNFLNNDIFNKELKNLNHLIKNNWYSYDNYNCLFGSTWTVGALYATQTGLPTIFGNNGKVIYNTIFNSIGINNDTKFIGYSNVLKKAGYNNKFISNCYLDFAGTGNLMKALGYEIYGGADFDKDIKRTNWGVQDFHLFEKAKEEYTLLSKQNRPFNLTLLTVDTHFSEGIPDESLRNNIDHEIAFPSHEFAVASLDYLLGDFIKYINESPNGKDTVIIILSDHLMMGNKENTPIISKLDYKERKNLLVSNTKIKNIGKDDYIGYYDIPNIILDSADVQHNVKFGKKFIPEMSDEFVKENKELFSILNLRLLQ